MSAAPDLPDYYSLIQALREDAARVGTDFSVNVLSGLLAAGAWSLWNVVVPAGEVWIITQAYWANYDMVPAPQPALTSIFNATTIVQFSRGAFLAGCGLFHSFSKPFLAFAGQTVRISVYNCGAAAASYCYGFAGYRI